MMKEINKRIIHYKNHVNEQDHYHHQLREENQFKRYINQNQNQNQNQNIMITKMNTTNIIMNSHKKMNTSLNIINLKRKRRKRNQKKCICQVQ